ncbi:MAG: hypothetical protein WCP53_06825, partial [Verrucomicrobiota bacterium]
WTPNATGIAAVGDIGTKAVAGTTAPDFFRVTRTALADHDSVTNSATTGGGGPGGGGGGAGPALASVTPKSGTRGSTVTLTMTLGGNPPPAAVLPRSAALGTITGTGVSRSGTTVTAQFTVPAGTSPGSVTVSVVFPGPPGTGDVTFSLVDGFTVL